MTGAARKRKVHCVPKVSGRIRGQCTPARNFTGVFPKRTVLVRPRPAGTVQRFSSSASQSTEEERVLKDRVLDQPAFKAPGRHGRGRDRAFPSSILAIDGFYARKVTGATDSLLVPGEFLPPENAHRRQSLFRGEDRANNRGLLLSFQLARDASE